MATCLKKEFCNGLESVNKWVRDFHDPREIAKRKGLKIWNGRGWNYHKREYGRGAVEHWYGCAKSGAQMIRLIQHYQQTDYHFKRTELRDYSSEGCWGNKMEGIEPEVGLWVERPSGKIERVV